MVLGAPFAGIASLVFGAISGVLAGFILGIFSNLLMWFAEIIPGLRSIAESHISPIMDFLVAAAIVIISGVAIGSGMGLIISALGRLRKNRSENTAAMVSSFATFIVIFFGLWVGNLKYNPQVPDVLQGWLGIVVGIMYAGLGGRVAAKTARENVAKNYFCETCNRFMEAQECSVTRESLTRIRNVLNENQCFVPERVQVGKVDSGSFRLSKCPNCRCGYIDLRVKFSATWKDNGSLSDEWLTASKRIESDACEEWEHDISKAKENSLVEDDERIESDACEEREHADSKAKENSLAEKDKRTDFPELSVTALKDFEGRSEDDLNEEYSNAGDDRRREIEHYYRLKGLKEPVVRIPCNKCGVSVLLSTVRVTDGLCMPCYKKKK